MTTQTIEGPFAHANPRNWQAKCPACGKGLMDALESEAREFIEEHTESCYRASLRRSYPAASSEGAE